MNSCIAILTYRRAPILRTFLKSLETHCPQYPVAVFEDCANADETTAMLTGGLQFVGKDREIEATVWKHSTKPFTVFLGLRNGGVAANSNRAIRWFERQPEFDHLCLCNDDLDALGDFPVEYAKAHQELGVGLFCHCDLKVLGDAYKGPEVKVLNTKVRIIPAGRQTGCMMSITRALVCRIGYYNVLCGRLGQEHVEYNNRAALAGFIKLRGQTQIAMDLAAPSLRMQLCRPSVSGYERQVLDSYANQAIRNIAAHYQTESWYVPFRMFHTPYAGGMEGKGISIKALEAVGYATVVDPEFHDLSATH